MICSLLILCALDIKHAALKTTHCPLQATLDAAGKGVRSVVFRLPQYVWGHGGSFFIPHQLDAARKLRKAYYILPGGLLVLCESLINNLLPDSTGVLSLS